jgi:hypothetical protein
VLEPPYKTGTQDSIAGIRGPQSGSFTFEAPLIPNGTAGTVPDLDPILQSFFGQAAAIVASTSATYSFVNPMAYLPFALFRFNKNGSANATHQYAGGCIPTRLVLNFGGPYSTMTADGKCVYVGLSDQFTGYTGNYATAAFGLTAYPVCPSSGAPLAVNGSAITGRTGTGTFDGNVMAELRGSLSITLNTGFDLAEDLTFDQFPNYPIGGRHTVSIGTLRFVDSDGVTLANLKTKAATKSPINISIAVNNVAGSTVTATLKNVTLAPAQIVENGAYFDLNLGESLAHATTYNVVDSFSLAFT